MVAKGGLPRSLRGSWDSISPLPENHILELFATLCSHSSRVLTKSGSWKSGSRGLRKARGCDSQAGCTCAGQCARRVVGERSVCVLTRNPATMSPPLLSVLYE